MDSYTTRREYLIDIKMTSDSEYAYWACDQDYGYVEMASGKVSRFLSPKSIKAIALAHNDKILVKADSDQTNLYALYQNIPRNDSFIWTPRSLAQLKFNSSSQILLTSKKNRKVFILTDFTLQVYDTAKNSFSLLSTIELSIKPKLSIPSNDGKRLYMKTDEKSIQILDISNPNKLHSIDFPEAFDDDFIVSSNDQMIFASRKINEEKTAFFAADISNPSNPEIGYLKINGETLTQENFAKLLMSKDSNTLVIFCNSSWSSFSKIQVTNLKEAKRKGSLGFYDSMKSPNYLVLSPVSDISYVIATSDIGQKEIQFLDPSISEYFRAIPALPIPILSGNLPPEISSDGKFLYVSNPEYLMEINVTNPRSPKFTRLMQLNIKQFSLVGDNNVMYAVIGDSLEILDMKSKYSLASIKEDFLLGNSYSIDLQLLSRNSKNNYNSINAKHKYLTANFYETSFSAIENDPSISYSVLPSWINFDKGRGRVSIEPKIASLLGSQKICTTGSFQLPSSAGLVTSLSFLNDSEDSNNLITDLIDKGYLDEKRFLTTKFNAYQKLSFTP